MAPTGMQAGADPLALPAEHTGVGYHGAEEALVVGLHGDGVHRADFGAGHVFAMAATHRRCAVAVAHDLKPGPAEQPLLLMRQRTCRHAGIAADALDRIRKNEMVHNLPRYARDRDNGPC